MKIKIFKVRNNSMHPTIKSGAYVFMLQSKLLHYPFNFINKFTLANHAITQFFQIKVGDIVAVNHPQYGLIIKRVTKIDYEEVMSLPCRNKAKSNCLKSSCLKSSCLKSSWSNNQKITRIRLVGDNKLSSISETQMAWVNASDLVGKLLYQTNPS